MRSKLWFLTKMSINKKIKSKWFYVANILFLILIVGLINIDGIIKFFGGDFDKETEILIIDEVGVTDLFKDNYETGSNYVGDYDKSKIVKYEKSYDEALKEVDEDGKILLVISLDNTNYINAKLVSKKELGTITKTLITTSLNSVRSELVLSKYNITHEMYGEINQPVLIENVILDDNNVDNNVMISTIMEILILPIFMLIMFLIQMIGAEVNEEKTTRSMEIIISNVSPRTHFLSKVIAANGFVLLQSLLLIVFLFVGVFVRFLVTGGNVLGGLETNSDVISFVNTIPVDSILDTVGVIIPVLLIMLVLTFFAYSLLAGILASMTTNLEDFQQLQTPLVIVSLAGFYLSMMSGIFKGSLFIKIMSYIPLISSMLAPTLYVLGEISIIDLVISILMLLGLIYLLIKFGLKVYKVGILNYSGTGLWKKMLKAVKEK